MKHFTYYTIIGKDLNLLKGHVENIKYHAGFDKLTCPKEFLMIVYRNNRIPAHVTNEILDYCHANDIRIEIYDEPTNNFIENLYALDMKSPKMVLYLGAAVIKFLIKILL